MATATLAATADSPAIPADSLYQLTVEQYHQMAEAGILTTEDRVELVQGLLLRKAKISPMHAFLTDTLRDRMNSLLVGWHARAQQPVTLADSEPEPDGALVRGRRIDYRDQHPAPPNIGIVVEVADSSLTQIAALRSGRMLAQASLTIGSSI